MGTVTEASSRATNAAGLATEEGVHLGVHLSEIIMRALTPGIHINAEEKRALNHALGRRNLALKNQGVEPAGRAHGDLYFAAMQANRGLLEKLIPKLRGRRVSHATQFRGWMTQEVVERGAEAAFERALQSYIYDGQGYNYEFSTYLLIAVQREISKKFRQWKILNPLPLDQLGNLKDTIPQRKKPKLSETAQERIEALWSMRAVLREKIMDPAFAPPPCQEALLNRGRLQDGKPRRIKDIAAAHGLKKNQLAHQVGRAKKQLLGWYGDMLLEHGIGSVRVQTFTNGSGMTITSKLQLGHLKAPVQIHVPIPMRLQEGDEFSAAWLRNLGGRVVAKPALPIAALGPVKIIKRASACPPPLREKPKALRTAAPMPAEREAAGDGGAQYLFDAALADLRQIKPEPHPYTPVKAALPHQQNWFRILDILKNFSLHSGAVTVKAQHQTLQRMLDALQKKLIADTEASQNIPAGEAQNLIEDHLLMNIPLGPKQKSWIISPQAIGLLAAAGKLLPQRGR